MKHHTPISGQPPYNGQTACPLPLTVHTFLPPTKGQPLNNGQNARPRRVHYSEVPLYIHTYPSIKHVSHAHTGGETYTIIVYL